MRREEIRTLKAYILVKVRGYLQSQNLIMCDISIRCRCVDHKPRLGIEVIATSLSSPGHKQNKIPFESAHRLPTHIIKMVGDLISFENEVTSSPNSINASPGSMPSKVDHVRGTHGDSFSDLTSMMKAKKPYTQAVPSAPPSLPLTTSLNGNRLYTHPFDRALKLSRPSTCEPYRLSRQHSVSIGEASASNRVSFTISRGTRADKRD